MMLFSLYLAETSDYPPTSGRAPEASHNHYLISVRLVNG